MVGYQVSLADVHTKRAFFKHIGTPMALRPVEFSALVLVAFNPGATQKLLAHALALSAPNTTLLLDRLAERGLVERVRSESDRRAQNIHLTAQGVDLAHRAYDASKTMETDLLRGLSQAEQLMLLELLHKVARHRHG